VTCLIFDLVKSRRVVSTGIEVRFYGHLRPYIHFFKIM
jgi:hypothetical protein